MPTSEAEESRELHSPAQLGAAPVALEDEVRATADVPAAEGYCRPVDRRVVRGRSGRGRPGSPRSSRQRGQPRGDRRRGRLRYEGHGQDMPRSASWPRCLLTGVARRLTSVLAHGRQAVARPDWLAGCRAWMDGSSTRGMTRTRSARQPCAPVDRARVRRWRCLLQGQHRSLRSGLASSSDRHSPPDAVQRCSPPTPDPLDPGWRRGKSLRVVSPARAASTAGVRRPAALRGVQLDLAPDVDDLLAVGRAGHAPGRVAQGLRTPDGRDRSRTTVA